MENFWIVTLFQFHAPRAERELLEQKGIDIYGAVGIEEFSLSEAEVDAILGERAYSGGDVPETVIDEVEDTVLSRPTSLRFFFEEDTLAHEFYKYCQTNILSEVQLEEHATEDWNAEWKKYYSPIKVNDKFEIIPSWLKDYVSTSKQSIYIYPGMGFGTGSHETTFLCLKIFTEEMNSTPETILDFGSGSGILGLSSLKFFPEAKVDFYDIDPDANKNCYQNAEINQLTDYAFRLLLPEVREKLLPKYDVIFANILENVLLLEKDYLSSALNPNGMLILSGLLSHQAENIIKEYSSEKLTFEKIEKKGDWVALMFKRKA